MNYVPTATSTNNPYFAILPTGVNYPAVCMPYDDRQSGWRTVKRRVRRAKVKTNAQLEEEAKMENWDDEFAHGYYQDAPTGEHNGALFDIGSRF